MRALCFDDSFGGLTDEIQNAVAFGCSRYSSLDLLKRLGGIEVAVIDEAIYILDDMNLIGRETAAVEPDGVDAAESNRFACCDSVRRYILAGSRAALDHTMRANMRELMHERSSADDGVVIHNDLARQLRGVGHNDIIMQDTVVRHVAVSHNEVVVANDGFSLARRSAMDCDELTEDTVVADDSVCLLAAELEILRYAADHGVRKDMTIIPDDHIVIDIGKGINSDILAYLRFRADISQRRDLIHLFTQYLVSKSADTLGVEGVSRFVSNNTSLQAKSQ